MSGDCVDVYMSIIRSPYSSDLVEPIGYPTTTKKLGRLC